MDDHRTGITGLAPASRMTDEELLLEYRSTGDEGLFVELVGRYQRELYSYLRRYLGDAAMAEDVFQAAFLQVHLKCDKFDAARRFRPWLYTIATNQAIDSQRRNRRHRAVSLDRRNRAGGEDSTGTLLDMMPSLETGPVEKLEAVERRDWVRQAVRDLPEQLGMAVQLVYYQGMKYREAAEVMAVPVGTVKSRLHSAINRLSTAWNDSHPSGPE
jgi:RNA polymerase sigma-70 factor (ECF subfamily)